MEDFWKPAFVNLVCSDLLKKASQALNEMASTYSEEMQTKKSECSESEFLAFLESEPERIRANPILERYYALKSKYGTIRGVVINEIKNRVADLQTMPNDTTDLVTVIERHPNYFEFVEGQKLERKISVLRDFHPIKKRRKFDPFSDAFKRAIADAANPIAGTTPAKLEFASWLARFVEAQANHTFWEYHKKVDTRFERLSKEQERLGYLEEQRKLFRDSPAVAFFDSQLYHIERDLEQREKVAMAIGVEIEPTLELFSVWQECNKQPAAFVQRVPYLKQMLEGLTEVRKLEFVEEELELRKQALIEKGEGETILKSTPPFDVQQIFSNNEFHETLKKTYEKWQEEYQPQPSRSKNEALTFEGLFVNPDAMKRALAAAIDVGLIEEREKGYSWSYKGAKGHGVCAFWFAVKEAGLTKKKLKNNERITGAIQAFFQMESLWKGTLDNANEFASEFVNLKRNLKNKMPDLQ